MIEQSLNIPVESKYNCRFCGIPIVYTGVKKGRPRLYCSDNCRCAVKYLESFFRCTEKANLTESSRRLLRGDLMTFINQSLPSPVKSKIGTEITEEIFSKTLNQISTVLESSL